MSDNLRGALWALLAAALFTLASALAKSAVTHYHVLQILFFRQLIVLLSSLPTIARDFPASLKTRYPGLHLARLGGAFTALSCSIWAVAVLPLTTTTTLTFTQVFFVSLLAAVLLGETVGRHRVLAAIGGFVGVLIVMRPGTDNFLNWHSLIPIVAAIGAAVAVNCVRRLSQTDSTATLLVYQSVFVGVLAGIPLFWFWQTPDTAGWLLLLGMGVIAAAGQWIGVKALRLGEASLVGNIEYTKLIYAGLLGYLLFAEVPDHYTITGAAVIILSALYMLYREPPR